MKYLTFTDKILTFNPTIQLELPPPPPPTLYHIALEAKLSSLRE